MTKNKYFVRELEVEVNGEEFTITRVSNDYNGNPRYVIHYTDLGVLGKDYGIISIPGFKKYRAGWYGGGYVFQSWGMMELELKMAQAYVSEWYKIQRKRQEQLQNK